MLLKNISRINQIVTFLVQPGNKVSVIKEKDDDNRILECAILNLIEKRTILFPHRAPFFSSPPSSG